MTTLPSGTVTFLFTDIEGSTRLLQGLGPDRYGGVLADQRTILRGAFERHEGTEIDTQGDAFFASFHRATQAVAAVVEIQRALMVHGWPEGVEVRLRMGLHTGEPLVAEEGYVGMDVHRAARIAHAGHGGQVLLSETTTSLVIDELPEGVDLLDLGRHRLKDMRRPEHIRQLVIKGLPGEFPPLKSLEMLPPAISLDIGEVKLPAFLEEEEVKVPPPVFVGREREMTRLGSYLDRAQAGQGSVVFITGGPGRGKTALMEAFARQAIEEHPDLLVAAGKCNAYTGAGDPYAPFQEVLGDLTGEVEAKWAAGGISSDHAKRLWQVLPETAQAIADHGPHLVEVFVSGKGLLSRTSLAVPDQRGLLQSLRSLAESERATPGELEQKALFKQYLEVLCQLASKHPLLILLDDLQWADTASLNLLFHLGREIPGGRILLLCAYRPEEVALGRGGERHPLEKVLGELGRIYGQNQIDLTIEQEREGRAFIDELLDSEPNRLSEVFRRSLFQHTQGHPLFTVELLRMLQERGDLSKDDQGHWVEGSDLNWQKLPARVETVIEERIGRLAEELRDILIVASVEGEDFTAQVVARVQEVRERGLLRRLNGELDRRHRLIQERGQQTVDKQRLYLYRFRHSLFQQHLYNGLAASERELLHAEVGAVLEELYGKNAEAIAPQLAWHFSEAREVERAVPYLLMAGDRARNLLAYQEAVDFYEQALANQKASGQLEGAASTLMRLGLTHQMGFDFHHAHHAFEESFSLRRQALAFPPEDLPPASEPLRLYWVYWVEPFELDPGIQEEKWAFDLIEQLFSGLLRYGRDWSIEPEVARSWEISDDGQRYTFHLRDDVLWSDGQPVTAHDFVFTWKRVLDPKTGARQPYLLYSIRGARAFNRGETADPDSVQVKAVDDHTLMVELEEPTAYFLYLLIYLVPVPRHTVERYGPAWAEPDNLISNGPFRLQEWIPGEKIRLARNPDYFGAFRGNLTQVELIFTNRIPPLEQLAAYNAGQVDSLTLVPETLPARYRFGQDYLQAEEPITRQLKFGSAKSPFQNRQLRRALALAVDKEQIIYKYMDGLELPASGGFLPPGFPGHSPGIGLPFNPEMARQLLADAGYPGGRGFPQINVLIDENHIHGIIAHALQEIWLQELGIHVHVTVMRQTEWLQNLRRSQLYLSSWVADYPDPDNFLRVSISRGAFTWRHARYDRLIKRAARNTDQAERLRLYQQADQILMEEAVIVPIAYSIKHHLIKPWVRNINPYHPIMKDVILEPH